MIVYTITAKIVHHHHYFIRKKGRKAHIYITYFFLVLEWNRLINLINLFSIRKLQWKAHAYMFNIMSITAIEHTALYIHDIWNYFKFIIFYISEQNQDIRSFLGYFAVISTFYVDFVEELDSLYIFLYTKKGTQQHHRYHKFILSPVPYAVEFPQCTNC